MKTLRNWLTVSESRGLRALLLAVIWPGGVVAHHSFTSIYDPERSETGERREWRAEMDNRSELEDIGMSARTFRPGALSADREHTHSRQDAGKARQLKLQPKS